jgi:nicotinate-nucleotide pyrophosphorylase (carboxylating)
MTYTINLPGAHANLLIRALAEDVGVGDATTEAIVDGSLRANATIIQKEAGVIFGLDLAMATFLKLDDSAEIEILSGEGIWHEAGIRVLRITASAAALLTGERTALNFLGHLSGIATYTASLVDKVRSVNQTVEILDTRKTTPGLRELEKAAVAAGGGVNHRIGLYDAILIKENHISVAGGISEAIRRVRKNRPDLPLAVEVRNRSEIEEALAEDAPRLLLDNMSPADIQEAVNLVAGRAKIEVSGGINPNNIVNYAEVQGIDFISMGSLTHSAPALDLSMLVDLQR